jgi:ribosomal protein L21E
MGQQKFKDGDRVQMTPETVKANPGARSTTGVVVGQARNPDEVRIKRDGQKSVVLWHETAWEPLTTTRQQEGE